MIETGNMSHTTQPHLLEDDDVISNYYDTLDSISNSVSETADSEMNQMENPMLNSMISGIETASYETVYEDITSSSSSEIQHDSEPDEDNTAPAKEPSDEEESSDEETDLRPLHEEFFITNQSDEEEPDETETDKKEKSFNHSLIEEKLKIMTNPMHDDKINYEDIDKLQTGDIILCHGGKDDSLIDKAIEYFTHSPWEHAAIIIRDPWWINSKLEDGVYVFQSGSGPNSYPDVINGSKCGVTLNKLDDFLRNREGIYIRTLNNFELDGGKKFLFKTAFETSHGKPYDKKPEHWTAACLGSFFRCPCISRNMLPREKEEFWCSALVSFMYTKMEWTNTKTDWSCKTPNDLMSIKLEHPYSLSDIWKLK
jgi:hypothetical protein